jgi:hypothetical protein
MPLALQLHVADRARPHPGSFHPSLLVVCHGEGAVFADIRRMLAAAMSAEFYLG